MANTPHLTITLLEQAQAQKEVTVNEALFRIDAVLNSGANDKDLATPPASPVAGDVYIIPAAATGAWAGKTGQVAYFDQIWRFIVPNAGLMLWVIDEAKHYVYNAGVWNVLNTGGGGGGMNPATYDPANIAQQLVGTSATQTLTNKTLTSCDANTQTAGNNSTKVATTAYVDAAVSAGGGGGGSASRVCEGRLTLTTGVPVTTSDVVGATNLFFTPYLGNNISLWNGTAWQTLTFTQITMALSGLTANLPYDVFAFINAGAVAIERLAWTSNTARATALATQNGVLVKSGDATRRYLGTFYSTGATTTEDSVANRYLWNYYNRAIRSMRRAEPAVNWTYTAVATRQANNSPANQLNFVLGVAEDAVTARVVSQASNNTTVTRAVFAGLALDSTTVNDTETRLSVGLATGFIFAAPVTQIYTPAAGRHFIAWTESGAGADIQTWYGSSLSHLSGEVRA